MICGFWSGLTIPWTTKPYYIISPKVVHRNNDRNHLPTFLHWASGSSWVAAQAPICVGTSKWNSPLLWITIFVVVSEIYEGFTSSDTPSYNLSLHWGWLQISTNNFSVQSVFLRCYEMQTWYNPFIFKEIVCIVKCWSRKNCPENKSRRGQYAPVSFTVTTH